MDCPELIRRACELLLLPVTTISTAQIYYYRIKHKFSTTTTCIPSDLLSIACINLASKTTEEPRKLRDTISAVYCICNKDVEYMKITSEYWKIRDANGHLEFLILRELKFDALIQLCYPWILRIVSAMLEDSPTAKAVLQLSFAIASDSYSKGILLDCSPRLFATCVVYIAYRAFDMNLPIEFSKWCHCWSKMPLESAASTATDNIQQILSIYTPQVN